MASMFDIVRILIAVVLMSICALPDLHSSARKVKRDMMRRKSLVLERLIRRSPHQQPKSGGAGVVRTSKTPSWRWSLPALFALGSVASASSVKFPASLQLKAGGNIISMPEVRSAWSWFPSVSTTGGGMTFLSAPALNIKGYVAKLFPSSLVSRCFPVGFSVPAGLTNPFAAVKSLIAGQLAAASEAVAVAKRDALARCLDSWSKLRMLPVRMQQALLAASPLPSLSSLAQSITSWSWSRPDDMFILAMSGGVGLSIIFVTLAIVMLRRQRRRQRGVGSPVNSNNNKTSSSNNRRQRQRQRNKQKKTSSGEEDNDTGSPPPPLPLRSSARISNKRALTPNTEGSGAGTGAAKKRPPRKTKKDKTIAEMTPPPEPADFQLSNASAGGMAWPNMCAAAPITGE
ncbi:hypothetical protein QBC42DRAFT_314063 [Cladorrhinum samala]|uniref:Uncharacterized protein n=1 Tax=Cladorrhinum samala TaxID=585594 RepID=A0AAV9HFE5_9PEZI|nr:hypothetical protein QBC42DRAFT_314063 [Cladorrhinum samala]